AAVTLGKQRIRVNSIHPGVIKTPMSQPLMENEMLRNRFLSRIPLVDFGDPLDIAYAALFLASDEAKFITGAEIVIDGGQTVSQDRGEGAFCTIEKKRWAGMVKKGIQQLQLREE